MVGESQDLQHTVTVTTYVCSEVLLLSAKVQLLTSVWLDVAAILAADSTPYEGDICAYIVGFNDNMLSGAFV